MIKNFLLFTIALTIYNARSQDYASYYKRCNLSDSLQYIGLNQEALDTYKIAFTSVDYVHSNKYYEAYHLAIKLGAFKDAFQFGKMIIINSGNKKLIGTKSTSFKRSNYFECLKDSTDFYLENYKNRVNHDFINAIDSLYFIDQNIIRKNRSVIGKYSLEKDTLPENLFELDKTNWQQLHKLIDSLGFPSEQNVGLAAYNHAGIIIHHNLRLKENEKYHNEIFQSIEDGKYLPVHFCFWYEQFQTSTKGQSFFFTWNGDTTEENLKRINLNRRSFYLKSSNAYALKNNGRKWRSKW